MPKPTIRSLVYDFNRSTNGKLQSISGKWFYDGNEIKNPAQYIARAVYQLDSPASVFEFLDMYRILFGTSELWPKTPLMDEGEALGKGRDTLPPLPIALTTEQLIIINRLLDGRDEVMFIATGIGGSGKSTYLNLIKQIFDNDVSATPLSDLSGYNIAEALKHRLIAADELSASDLDARALKTIISKQEIAVNPKFEKPYQTRAQSGIFYCCNRPPRIDIDDTGILRRIIYYEMNKKIENPDVTRQKQIFTRDELLSVIAHATRVDVTDWRKHFRDQTYKYLSKYNSVYLCWDALNYADYRRCCSERGYTPYSENRWHDIRDIFLGWATESDVIEGKDF